ncbi:MAG: hypothetical protein M3349_05955, partial [Actinomycetota bacterium]|nr:hypothetical protein [Actinomycetota bacterium]
MDTSVLTLLVVIPAVGAVVMLLLPRRRPELLLPVAVLVTMLPVAVAGYLLVVFDPAQAGFQFTSQVLWYQPWDISWNVGVDGISLLLVALTALLFPLSL